MLFKTLTTEGLLERYLSTRNPHRAPPLNGCIDQPVTPHTTPSAAYRPRKFPQPSVDSSNTMPSSQRSPSDGSERKGDRKGGRQPVREPTRSSAARNERSRPALQERYSPEDLFLMLKEYEFQGRLASVGIRGPSAREPEERPDSGSSCTSSPTHPSSNKVGKQDIWTDEAEFAFLAAELYLPPTTANKVMFMQKPCGRNEIIALIITMALGKHMTRKQVSSHLQVVRQRKKMNAEVRGLFDQNANDRAQGGGSPETGTPKLHNIHNRLYKIIGIDQRYNLSDMNKPEWILQHEAASIPTRATKINRLSAGSSDSPVRKGEAGWRASPSPSESKRTTYLNLPLSTRTSEMRNRQGPSCSADHQHDNARSPAPSHHFARAPSTDFDELESDDGDRQEERDIDRVSESTPRASPGPEDYYRLASPAPSPLFDFQLRFISIGWQRDALFVHANLPENLVRVKMADIPAIALRLARWPITRCLGTSQRAIHVLVGVDLNNLTTYRNQFLNLDLIVSARAHGLPARGSLLKLCSTSGYLDVRRERVDTIQLETMASSPEDDDDGRVALRPVNPYEDGLLVQLISSSPDPANAVLPYFWVVQEIVTPQASLNVIYTFKAESRWSLSAHELV